jgi:hypothetical protein
VDWSTRGSRPLRRRSVRAAKATRPGRPVFRPLVVKRTPATHDSRQVPGPLASGGRKNLGGAEATLPNDHGFRGCWP